MTPPGGFLRPASFRGVPFFVRRESRPFPRSLQVDEYPASDRWSVIDLGRKAPTWRIEAYVADESDVEVRMAALEAALQAPGPGLLILPQRSPVLAYARAPESGWDHQHLGYFSFKVEFVEEGPLASAGPSLGLAESGLVAAMSVVAALAAAAGVRLASSGAVRRAGSFESTAFSREADIRLAGLQGAALNISADDEVVSATRTANGFAGQAAIADALSVIGESGLTALEERASA